MNAKLEEEKFQKILKILKCSRRSEQIDSYDEDYSWIPAGSIFAREARAFNRELEELISFVEKRIEELKDKR